MECVEGRKSEAAKCFRRFLTMCTADQSDDVEFHLARCCNDANEAERTLRKIIATSKSNEVRAKSRLELLLCKFVAFRDEEFAEQISLGLEESRDIPRVRVEFEHLRSTIRNPPLL